MFQELATGQPYSYQSCSCSLIVVIFPKILFVFYFKKYFLLFALHLLPYPSLPSFPSASSTISDLPFPMSQITGMHRLEAQVHEMDKVRKNLKDMDEFDEEIGERRRTTEYRIVRTEEAEIEEDNIVYEESLAMRSNSAGKRCHPARVIQEGIVYCFV